MSNCSKYNPSVPFSQVSATARCALLFFAMFASSCTYGPEERTVKLEQIVRLGDSFDAIVVIRHDRYRRPRGLSTFPDAAKWNYLERGSTQYLIDARRGDARLLARESAPDRLWESFSARIVGISADTTAYLRLSGCPRGGGCYPKLRLDVDYRLSPAGGLKAVDNIPAGARLPGVMVARRPGERNYVRFGTNGDTVTVRLDESGPATSMFRARPDGTLVAVGS